MLRLLFIVVCAHPDLETAILLVANLSALLALHHISLCALIGLMAYLVALKAELCVAVEAVMLVAATEDAVWAASFIWTFARHVPKLLAISALYRRI